jgi:glucose/arabinose dehydrogenase
MLNKFGFALFIVAASVSAAAEDYRLETVVDELSHPWSLAFLPGGEMLVTQRTGQLRRISAAGEPGQPIEGVPIVYFAGQGGLHDVVLHPDFEQNDLIYLSYAEGSPDYNGTAVARAKLAGNVLQDLAVIYRVSPRKDTPVHYGGRMAFLADGTLLITTGDGFDYREAAQDIDSNLGKVIRINDDGSPASGNPFPESPFVWSYGHRNPQGLAIDNNGVVYLHEHGPRGGDELNVVGPGINYGWPAITYGIDYNGAYVTPYQEWEGMQQPIHYWVPSIGPSGLAVYDGDLFPEWRGDLFVGALVDKEVRRLNMEAGKVVNEEPLFSELDARIRDIRSGPDGALYIVTDGDPGKIVRVVRD